MIKRAAKLTDRLEHIWEEQIMKRAAGTVLVVAYLFMILLIEFNRQGIIPGSLAESLPTTHFFAVEVAFTLLLLTEVVSLIFGLTRSFSRSIGIQLEILSLILLRDTFKEFSHFGEPLAWVDVVESLPTMVADSLGALAIFTILGIYYRIQKGKPITDDEIDQQEFICYKKVISLGLIVTFAFVGIMDLIRFLVGAETYPFFETFYTILIFTDVLMVLLSMRYSNSFAVTFRNFGYAVVTVFIRIALIAPPLLGVALGIGTAVFALMMAFVYNHTGGDIIAQAKADHQKDDQQSSAYYVSSGD